MGDGEILGSVADYINVYCEPRESSFEDNITYYENMSKNEINSENYTVTEFWSTIHNTIESPSNETIEKLS